MPDSLCEIYKRDGQHLQRLPRQLSPESRWERCWDFRWRAGFLFLSSFRREEFPGIQRPPQAFKAGRTRWDTGVTGYRGVRGSWGAGRASVATPEAPDNIFSTSWASHFRRQPPTDA